MTALGMEAVRQKLREVEGADEDDDSHLYWACGYDVGYYQGLGELIFRGKGTMLDYSEKYPGPWCDYDIDTVLVKDGVENIGNYAFITVFGKHLNL